MTPRDQAARWAALQAHADRPGVQEEIGRAIRSRAIRVAPAPGGGIVIMPLGPGAGGPRARLGR